MSEGIIQMLLEYCQSWGCDQTTDPDSVQKSWISNCKAGVYGEWDEKYTCHQSILLEDPQQSGLTEFSGTTSIWNKQIKKDSKLAIWSFHIKYTWSLNYHGRVHHFALKKYYRLPYFNIFISCAILYLKREWQLVFWIFKNIYHSFCCNWIHPSQ